MHRYFSPLDLRFSSTSVTMCEQCELAAYYVPSMKSSRSVGRQHWYVAVPRRSVVAILQKLRWDEVGSGWGSSAMDPSSRRRADFSPHAHLIHDNPWHHQLQLAGWDMRWAAKVIRTAAKIHSHTLHVLSASDGEYQSAIIDNRAAGRASRVVSRCSGWDGQPIFGATHSQRQIAQACRQPRRRDPLPSGRRNPPPLSSRRRLFRAQAPVPVQTTLQRIGAE